MREMAAHHSFATDPRRPQFRISVPPGGASSQRVVPNLTLAPERRQPIHYENLSRVW
jgi:hypothetical protein